jgi:hypothetical protein
MELVLVHSTKFKGMIKLFVTTHKRYALAWNNIFKGVLRYCTIFRNSRPCETPALGYYINGLENIFHYDEGIANLA